jgi:hypothetical protein
MADSWDYHLTRKAAHEAIWAAYDYADPYERLGIWFPGKGSTDFRMWSYILLRFPFGNNGIYRVDVSYEIGIRHMIVYEKPYGVSGMGLLRINDVEATESIYQFRESLDYFYIEQLTKGHIIDFEIPSGSEPPELGRMDYNVSVWWDSSVNGKDWFFVRAPFDINTTIQMIVDDEYINGYTHHFTRLEASYYGGYAEIFSRSRMPGLIEESTSSAHTIQIMPNYAYIHIRILYD